MTDLVAAIMALADIGTEVIWKVFLVLLRVGAVMALLPAFGEQSVPQRVRLVLTFAFSAIVAPAVMPNLPGWNGTTMSPFAIEAGIGLALGISLRLFVHALQVAGVIAAQATSLSQLSAGSGPEPQPAIGQFLVIAGLALATASGLHIRVAQFLILSYEILPAGEVPSSADFAQWGLTRIGNAFGLGFSLAGPFVIASVLYNLALGVINRAMPALMVSMIGAPLQVFGGLALLALVAPMALAVWHHGLTSFLISPMPGER